MDNLELEVVVIDGKKIHNCSKVLILFHAVLLLFVGAFCSYYISMNKLDYDTEFQFIKEQIKFMNTKTITINQKIDKTENYLEYKNNYLVSFVQKGYESGEYRISIAGWWNNLGWSYVLVLTLYSIADNGEIPSDVGLENWSP